MTKERQNGFSGNNDKNTEYPSYVLDSYAVLAYFKGEKGAGIVADLILKTAENVTLFLSLINFGEVAYITEREEGTRRANDLLEDIHRLPIIISGVDEERILAAARIKAHYPVSFADSFAIALADEFSAPVVTGDPEFRRTEALVSVLWLR